MVCFFFCLSLKWMGNRGWCCSVMYLSGFYGGFFGVCVCLLSVKGFYLIFSRHTATHLRSRLCQDYSIFWQGEPLTVMTLSQYDLSATLMHQAIFEQFCAFVHFRIYSAAAIKSHTADKDRRSSSLAAARPSRD